jgi:hypothetical protein
MSKITHDTVKRLETALHDVPYGEAKAVLDVVSKAAEAKPPAETTAETTAKRARRPRSAFSTTEAEERAKRAKYQREYRAKQAALKAAGAQAPKRGRKPKVEATAPEPLPVPPPIAEPPLPFLPPVAPPFEG